MGGRLVEHAGVAEQRRQRAQRVAHVGGRRDLAHHALERGDVLAGQRLLELLLARAVGLDLLQQTAEEVGMAEVELEAVEAQGPQALDGHGDDLHLGLGLLEPDQLDAGLVELAIVRHLRLVVAEHVGHVAKPQRLGLLAQPGGDDPRDLGRDVGAQRQHPARLAVDQLEHVLLHPEVGAPRQHVRVLEGGGDDLAVAPAAEHVEQLRLDVPLAGRFVGQVDPRPPRQLRVHGPHRPPSSPRAGTAAASGGSASR